MKKRGEVQRGATIQGEEKVYRASDPNAHRADKTLTERVGGGRDRTEREKDPWSYYYSQRGLVPPYPSYHV